MLAADEIGPGELGEFAARGRRGVVLAGGSPTAHAVVVARGLGLPLVLRAGDRLGRRADGTLVAVDGDAGTVEVDPPDAGRASAPRSRPTRGRAAPTTGAARPRRSTVGGRRIVVAANVGSLAEARAAVANGADGVGLLRTELLVLDGAELPDEDEQAADLAAIFDVLGDRPVVVRVLDAGGDKPVRALRLDPGTTVSSACAGCAGCWPNPDVLHTQLRAILRAGRRSPGRGDGADGVASRAEAGRSGPRSTPRRRAPWPTGPPHAAPEQVGVMVEVPAAALAVDEIAAARRLRLASAPTTWCRTRWPPTAPSPAWPTCSTRAAWPSGGCIEQLCGQANEAGSTVAVCGELAAVPGSGRPVRRPRRRRAVDGPGGHPGREGAPARG